MKTPEEMREFILNSDNAVELAILLLYKKQTEDEKQTQSTNHNNNIGFNGGDARWGSSMATLLNEDKFLNPKQLADARKKLKKYNKQITKLYNGQEHFRIFQR